MICQALGRVWEFFSGPELRLVPKLGRIVEQVGPVVPTPHLRVAHSVRFLRRFLLMAFQITDSQQVTLGIKALDKKGNPAPIEGVEWSTDKTDLLALVPSADGLSCTVLAVGPLGIGTVTMKADAQMGEGESPIVGTLQVEVTGGQAVTVKITAGTPEEQPTDGGGGTNNEPSPADPAVTE